MIIIKYENKSEVQGIIDSQTALGMHVVAVSNVGEGNFLGFDDRVDIQPANQEILDGQQTIKDGMADMFIAISSIPGVVL